MKIRKRKDFANDISRLKCNLTVEWFGILLENSIAIQVKTIVYNKDVVLSFFFVFRRLIYSNENDTERRTRRSEPPRVIIRSRSAGTSPFFKKKNKKTKTTTNAGNLPWRNTLLWRLIGLPYSNFKSISAESLHCCIAVWCLVSWIEPNCRLRVYYHIISICAFCVLRRHRVKEIQHRLAWRRRSRRRHIYYYVYTTRYSYTCVWADGDIVRWGGKPVSIKWWQSSI
jgi:hypothetical protein